MPSKSEKIEGILLDCDYRDSEEQSIIRIFAKTIKGIQAFEIPEFKPYFYIITDGSLSEKKLLEKEFGEHAAKISTVEEVKKENAKNVFKLSFNKVSELTEVREEVKHARGVLEKREYDIQFAKRFLIDNALQPMNGIEIELSPQGKVESIGSPSIGIGIRVRFGRVRSAEDPDSGLFRDDLH